MSMALSVLLGCVFGALAALTAWVIVAEAGRRQRFDAARRRRESAWAAAFAFAVFFAGALVLGAALRGVLRG